MMLVAQSPTLENGTILLDRYKILRLRALGGMGAVYEAQDLRFARAVRRCAVKEIISSASDLDTRRLNMQSFEREANILASLNHPAIPRIYDYFSVGQQAYLILEYVEGEDLGALLERTAAFLPENRVLHWALQICDVLEYLHSHPEGPIIFRDVKPSNIMLCADDRIVLVDFGIAKVFANKRGTMVGTEGYTPPEQYRGLALPQGDIYALGATLHHLLTLRDPRVEPPFSFQNRMPRAINPAISPQTEAIIMRAVEYEVEKRFASAGELKRAIEEALDASGVATPGLPAIRREQTKQRVAPVWQFACEDEVRSTPVVDEGCLYIGSYDCHLYALDAQEGKLLWKYATEGGICVAPCILEDKVFFGSEDCVFYALSRRTGRILWCLPTGGRIRSSALAAYGHVFFGSDDGHLCAVSAESGRVIWKFAAGGPIRCRPLLVMETIVFGSEDGLVYGLDMGSGALKWKQRTSRGVVSSPCLGDGLIYVGSRDWHLYALSPRSGWPIWRFRTNNWVISSPAVADNRVFFGSVDANVYALDAHKGRLLWSFATEGQVTSSPAAQDGVVYIGSVDSHLYCLDAKTGQERWRFQTDGPVPSSPTVAEGLVYIGSMDGVVYALREG